MYRYSKMDLSNITSAADRKTKIEAKKAEVAAPNYGQKRLAGNLLNFLTGRVKSWCDTESVSAKDELKIKCNTSLLEQDDIDSIRSTLEGKGYELHIIGGVFCVCIADEEETSP